ncbi:MAG: hypothetical protein IPL39_07715 [Opitutaceae bacterium]|nr:hypothetical protein [Opitutaceae bacterium]
MTLAHLDIIDGTGLNFFIGPSGGAILSLGNLTMQDCNLSGNSAETGGAICNYQGNLTMQGCSLSGNAARDGGAICNVQGNLTMQDCSLSGNAVVKRRRWHRESWDTGSCAAAPSLGNQALIGGGIASMGPMTLQNCTLSGNQATGTDPGDGGGAIFQFGDTVLEHCTIVGNTAAGPNEATSGIFILNGTLTLNNSIVANNGAGGTDNFSVTGGTFTSLGYNLSNDWNGRATTTGDLTANPLLGALANNGGPTRTHALLAGSPAINAADPADATATDQRGALRPQNGRSDIGAYEVVTSIAPTFGTDPTPQTVFSGSTATFTVVASGIPAPTLRWQRNPLGSGSWSDLSDNATYGGTTTNTLTVLSTIGLNTDQFRCVATNSVSFATSAAATLTVHKATPVLTWHQPADLIYGSSLSATQLNASASVAGVFTYDPPAGTVLAVGTEQTLCATFTPADPANCESATVSTIITVHRSAQSIDFPPLPDLTVPPASLTLGASASSGLRVGYSVSGPARLSGNVLTFTGIGEIVVTARQPGNSNYMAAADVVRRFNVSKRFASVTVGNRTVTYDGTPHALTATTTPAGLNVVVTYSGSPTAPTSAGTYAVVATIDDADYAGESTGTLVIAKAPTSLTWPAPAAIVYGTPLSAAQLNATANVPGVVTYTPAAGTALHAGIHPLAAAFTPTDSGNYMAATAPNTLTVTPAPLTVRVDDLTITRGSPIPTGMPRFSGWINGDGPSALLNPVVVATTASASSPAGTYALVPVGGASFDYAITRINGTLTIAAPAAPSITTQPASQSTTAGGTVTVSVTARGEGLTYQWYRQGLRIPDATSPTLTLPGAGPTAAGIYDCLVTGSGSSVLSRPVVIGIVPAPGTRTSGSVTTRSEWQGIQPLVGVAYDQFLLAGNAGTFTAAPGRVARMSFLDENESIVQVEMSGAGAVTIVLANASGPMAPALYNQPGILYMKGKPTIILAGADETTHFTIYSVGTATNPGVTRADVDYAGWADVAVAGIVSTNGGLGGIHQGNVAFTAATGFTGLYAPTVTSVGGLVVVHDIAASASAVPYLYFGPTAGVQVKIAGGSLAQPNNDVLTVSGLSQVQMGAGQDSCGRPAPAQAIQTRLVEDNGTDVTPSIVTGP